MKPSLGAAACRFSHLDVTLLSVLITSHIDLMLKLFQSKLGFIEKQVFHYGQAAGSQRQLKGRGESRTFNQKPQIRSVREGGEKKQKLFCLGFFPSHVKNHQVLARLSLFLSSTGGAEGWRQFARALGWAAWGRDAPCRDKGTSQGRGLQAPRKPCWEGTSLGAAVP